MKKVPSILFLPIVLVLIFGTTFSSCKDDEGPAKAEIFVYDTAGIAQEGVFVNVFCTQEDCIVDDTKRTNSRGFSTHEFDLPAVLRVRAVRYDSTIEQTGIPPNVETTVVVDSVCAETFVTVDNGETAKESLTLLPCN